MTKEKKPQTKEDKEPTIYGDNMTPEQREAFIDAMLGHTR